VLRSDYADYQQHILFSGCGAIERRGPYLLMDVSQLHVGGYTSVMLIREADGALFLLWLRTTVAEANLKIYSEGL